jgi:outer membrane protein assembly factor BamB
MPVMPPIRSARKVLCLALVVQAALFAQDWPQWRGPNRDGVADARLLPAKWPSELVKKWQVQVGAGHSSPVAAGKRVYLHSRQGEQEVVSSYDLTSGKLIWTDRYAAPYTMNPSAASHGKGPKSTPALSAGKLYTLGIAGIVSCYDAAGGKLLWRKETGSAFKTSSPLYGVAMSPVVDGASLIVHAGGEDSGALLALDADTGRQRWAWNADGPAYSSPLVVDLAGIRQVVTQTQRFIVGVAAADGSLLWKMPFTTPWDQNAVTLVRYNDLLVFSGLDRGTAAVRITRSGSACKAEKVWETREASFYMSTPVVYGDSLIGLSHLKRGQVVRLDARTGKLLWAGDGRTAENASAVVLGDTLLLLSEGATLTVSRIGPVRLEPIRTYTVAGSPTWAHLAVSSRCLLVKDAGTLAMWSTE